MTTPSAKPPTTAPGSEDRPPIATAMKPRLVKNWPVSNCNDVVGATTTPATAATAAASAKANSVMRGRLTPIQTRGRGVLGAGAQRLAEFRAREQIPKAADTDESGAEDPGRLDRHQDAAERERLRPDERPQGKRIVAPDDEQQTFDKGQKAGRQHQHVGGGKP